MSLFGKLLDEPDAATVAVQAAMASVSDPARIREVLHGWDDVTVTPVATETTWGRDAADAVDFILSRTPCRTVDADTRTALRDTLHPYETDRGVRLQAAVWLMTAKWRTDGSQ
ncbi:hypothetical protein [Streptomyces olivochromogenes]|uniref:Methyltransferase n=1 Tax=Streptomyces olivochromogenes TaxID=1963 RepID=A0A250V3B6_STROL|nr:hypothetical protein [Streptomyces olivochromogenes]KUN48702.1 hypothetical protein AQJ27_05785 [Streptomyces olivochromogenes]GAX48556.1 methyltransferase [Streptomyces olivochromogenes]